MSAKRGTERFSLSRWSRRKLEAAAKPVGRTPAPSSASAAASSSAPGAPAPIATAAPLSAAPAPELPPVESLSFESDFSVFLRPGVEEKLRQAALKKLLHDPRFNVMDGLDTYIDDYTKADPIPPDVLAGLVQRFGQAFDIDQAPAAAASMPAENPAAETPVAYAPAQNDAAETSIPEAPAPEKPAIEVKAQETAGGSRESGTTPAHPRPR
jgi:hypothetical protein